MKIALVSILFTSTSAFAGDAPKAMEMPKPAQQVVDRLKERTGTWKCDGTSIGMDMKDIKFSATMTTKSDLDGFWVHETFVGKAGEGKAAWTYKFENYSTYDTGMKKWREIIVDNFGGQAIGTGDDHNLITSDMVDGMGKGMMKDHEDASDLKKGLHVWGEASKDAGKTWMKIYDLTCKK